MLENFVMFGMLGTSILGWILLLSIIFKSFEKYLIYLFKK